MSEQFAALGDDHRLLIIAKRGRKWNAENKVAEVFPTEAVVCGAGQGQLRSADFGGLPHDVSMTNATA